CPGFGHAVGRGRRSCATVLRRQEQWRLAIEYVEHGRTELELASGPLRPVIDVQAQLVRPWGRPVRSARTWLARTPTERAEAVADRVDLVGSVQADAIGRTSRSNEQVAANRP